MQIISWSFFLSKLNIPGSVNYPPISGDYVIIDKLEIGSSCILVDWGDLHSSDSRPLKR